MEILAVIMFGALILTHYMLSKSTFLSLTDSEKRTEQRINMFRNDVIENMIKCLSQSKESVTSFEKHFVELTETVKSLSRSLESPKDEKPKAANRKPRTPEQKLMAAQRKKEWWAKKRQQEASPTDAIAPKPPLRRASGS